LSKITAIATATPAYGHTQDDLFTFADKVYCRDAADSRKLRFLYRKSGIEKRYSVLADYNLPAADRTFFSQREDLEPFPSLEKRMACFNEASVSLSVGCINECIDGKIKASEITHLVTVSCTGLSAPGLDLQVMQEMGLSPTLQRTSVNFMGCYAAVHGMKLAQGFCAAMPAAKVVVVCTELCTLHFQKEVTQNNMMSSMLFSDGCAAILVQNDETAKGFNLDHFFSHVDFKGKNDMAWELSGQGFLMTLSGYVPDLIKADFEELVTKALASAGKTKADVTHWCMHPGGKKILEVIAESLQLQEQDLSHSYEVLRQFGNMSSASILFVLQRIMQQLEEDHVENALVIGAAFGPGLTMETFLASYG
jgi:predicted naringenin-chalcone synthase